MQYLGIQEAPRKRRPPSQNTGDWAGGMLSSADREVIKSFTPEKGDKGEKIIYWLLDEISQASDDRPTLNFKTFESAAGYMYNLSMTHEGFHPFLKEIYLTLNSRRSQRDKDGWKVPDKRWIAFLAGCEDNG
jgi:hypothetical protein